MIDQCESINKIHYASPGIGLQNVHNFTSNIHSIPFSPISTKMASGSSDKLPLFKADDDK